jgi:TonB family protein
LPRQSVILLAVVLISFLVHVASYISLDGRGSLLPKDLARQASEDNKIKLKIVEKPAAEPVGKVIETPQQPTEKPKDATHLSYQDHQTAKETKPKPSPVLPKKARSAGPEGVPQQLAKESPTLDPAPAPQAQQPKTKIDAPSPMGLPIVTRNAYERLLSSASKGMQGQVDAGYQDYVDDAVADGDFLNLNTSDYRFTGYMSTLRKSIELVWVYPMAAVRRQMEGSVGVEFIIGADGTVSRVRVIKTSGFEILDKAIVDAIKLASPFAPLPAGFGRNKLPIRGTFSYTLRPFM